MNRDTPISNEELLDYVLERCEWSKGNRIAAAIETDPAVAARYQRLYNLLEPLDTWTTSEPPDRMVSNILDSVVQRANPRLRLVPGPLPRESAAPSRSRFSLRELLATAACIGLLFLALFPGMRGVRFHSQRAMCGDNMRSIYAGTTAYAAANASFLPFAMPASDSGGSWLDRSGKVLRPNSRHLMLVPQGGYVPVARLRIWVCPSLKNGSPMSPDMLRDASLPIASRHFSYHSQQMGGATPRRIEEAQDTDLPFLGDPNPVFEGDRFNPNVDPATTNSASHNSRGQNVLQFNGAVLWTTTPKFEPILGDNLWQIEDRRRYDGTEEPRSATDAFLVP